MTAPLTWVVGAGGLLGSHVTRAQTAIGPLWTPGPLPWGTAEAACRLRQAAQAFRRAAAGGTWQVAWCAGAGVTGTGPGALACEAEAFEAMLDGLGGGSEGALFLASSAGGVYAGSSGAPFDESSCVRPLSAYGDAKLHLEATVREWSGQNGVPVVLGRIANLYGPGQDVTKPQGLISQVCRAHLLRRPVSIFVPLDTVRDYLYAEDGARLVVGCLRRLRAEPAAHGPGVHVKVLASQQAVTVGAVLAELRRILRHAPLVVLAASPLAGLQTRDLRLRSRVWTDLDRGPVTPLPVGITRTLQGLARDLQRGRLA